MMSGEMKAVDANAVSFSRVVALHAFKGKHQLADQLRSCCPGTAHQKPKAISLVSIAFGTKSHGKTANTAIKTLQVDDRMGGVFFERSQQRLNTWHDARENSFLVLSDITNRESHESDFLPTRVRWLGSSILGRFNKKPFFLPIPDQAHSNSVTTKECIPATERFGMSLFFNWHESTFGAPDCECAADGLPCFKDAIHCRSILQGSCGRVNNG